MTSKIILSFLLLCSSLFAEVLSSTKPAIKKVVKVEESMNLRVSLKFEIRRAQKLKIDVFNTKKKNFLHVEDYGKGKLHTYNVPVEKGTYIIILHTKDEQWYHTPLKFAVSKVKSYYEIEPNNSFKTASKLEKKKLLKGYLQSKRGKLDEDFYKLVLDRKASLTLTINHKPSNNGQYTVEVFDSLKNKELEFKTEFNKNSTTKYLPLELGLYYVKVTTNDKILHNNEYKLTYVLNKIQE